MESVVEALRGFLGDDGISFFLEVREKFGKVNAIFACGDNEEMLSNREEIRVYQEERKRRGENPFVLPHSVHFREGMQVRNFLRTLPECSGWTAHDYDERWVGLVEEAIDAPGRDPRSQGNLSCSG